MYSYCFLLLLLCFNVLCDNCVVFNFEANFTNDFTYNDGICSGLSKWNLRRYIDLSMEAPHKNSSHFIAPQSALSCISSFVFSITAGGTFDVNFYMDSAAPADYLILIVSPFVGIGLDPVAASLVLSPTDPNLIRGWQNVKYSIPGHHIYNGYVTLMGVASESSVILIDSIRYMSPSSSEELCEIYKQDVEDDTPETTSTIIPETTTRIMPETTTSEMPETTSTIMPETTTTAISEPTSTIMPETTSTIMPETTSMITPETTSSTFLPQTTSTSKPDSTTETTTTTSLTTTTENDPETSSMTNNFNLNKNDVRVNVNINIQ